MIEVSYRPMVAADLASTALVRRSAIASLERSEGREPDMAPIPPPPLIHRHILKMYPGGSWVGEINGLVMGYAQALVRGDVWYLSQLFVLPEVHGHDLGRGVLERALAYGDERGARVRAVIASSSPVAQALYMRAGMMTAGVGYRISGPVDALLALPEPQANQKRVVDCSGWQDRIAALDREVWGAELRDQHTLFLYGGGTLAEETGSFALTQNGELLGYGYVSDDGWTGSIAAREPQTQLPLLRTAGDWLAERGVERANLFCISHNATVLGALLVAGWRIDNWNYFMTSGPFMQTDRYVPSGGLLL